MKTHHHKILLLIAVAVSAALSAKATNYYVDSIATGSHNGTSWANAWTSLSAVTGVSAGDTVYISGGPSGSTQLYNTGTWAPAGGASGNPITYKIGQDASHNGTAVFYTGSGSSPGLFLSPASNLAIIGDAGDGNMHFSAIGVNTILYSNPGSFANIRLAYINFGPITSNGGNPEDVLYANTISGFEFDHNYVNMTSPTANAFAYMVTTDSSWDGTKIHDNTIYVLRSFAIGPDVFEFGGSTGYSIYNNVVHSVAVTANSGTVNSQHQDFWQDTGGSSYIKLHDNHLTDMGNSCFFAEGDFGGFSHVWIYNNVGEMTATVDPAWFPEGITVLPTGSGAKTFNDVQVMNNLMADMGGGLGFTVSADSYSGATFTSCNVYNNISINCATIDIGSGVTAADNVAFTLSANNGDFAVYTPHSTGNNYHLTSSAASLRNLGTNQSTYFATDKDGVSRPGTGEGPWDIGPYEYASSSSPSTLINVQFGSTVNGLLQKSGFAAAPGYSPLDYWNVIGNSPDDDPPTTGNPACSLANCLDYSGTSTSIGVSLWPTDYGDPPVGGAWSSSFAADRLLDSYEFTSGGSDFELDISGLSGTYDIYLYSTSNYNPTLHERFAVTFTVMGGAHNWSSISPLSTSSANYDVNSYVNGNQYVVFHLTAPESVGSTAPLVIKLSGIEPMFYGLQIVQP